MPPRRPGPSLSYQALRACREAYAAGATFGELASRHGVAEITVRRLLKALGVEPRPPGTAPAAIPPLVLEDARAGLSAHEIARKWKLPRPRINALLRDRGLARTPRTGAVLHPLGDVITARRARLRRKPPTVIAGRTPAERLVRRWTAPELAAIEQAVAAGRVTCCYRGERGLPEALTWHEQRRAEWLALHGQQAA